MRLRSLRMVVLIVCITPALAVASPCRVDDGAAARVVATANRSASQFRIWQWSWVAGFAVAGVGQYAVARKLEDPGLRLDLYVGATKSILGAISTAIMPKEVGYAPAPTGDPCADLAGARVQLLQNRVAERAGIRLWRHVSVVGLNVGTLVVMGSVFDRWPTAITAAIIGTAVGEIHIWTQPTGALDFGFAPFVTPTTTGIGMSGRF